jgi:hypothetical protein
LRFVLAVVLASLVLVPSALAAGGSAGKGYGGEGGNVQTQVSAGTAAKSGGLPFTGLDLGLLVAGGAVLVVAGAALRRAARRTS